MTKKIPFEVVLLFCFLLAISPIMDVNGWIIVKREIRTETLFTRESLGRVSWIDSKTASITDVLIRPELPEGFNYSVSWESESYNFVEKKHSFSWSAGINFEVQACTLGESAALGFGVGYSYTNEQEDVQKDIWSFKISNDNALDNAMDEDIKARFSVIGVKNTYEIFMSAYQDFEWELHLFGGWKKGKAVGDPYVDIEYRLISTEPKYTDLLLTYRANYIQEYGIVDYRVVPLWDVDPITGELVIIGYREEPIYGTIERYEGTTMYQGLGVEYGPYFDPIYTSIVIEKDPSDYVVDSSPGTFYNLNGKDHTETVTLAGTKQTERSHTDSHTHTLDLKAKFVAGTPISELLGSARLTITVSVGFKWCKSSTYGEGTSLTSAIEITMPANSILSYTCYRTCWDTLYLIGTNG